MDGPRQNEKAQVLATDLDGTLIPLEGHIQNQTDLKVISQELIRSQVELVFVTGRHIESVLNAIQQHELPSPDWIICDVGTSLFKRLPSKQYQIVAEYYEHQDSIVAELPFIELQRRLQNVDGLLLQEQEKQGRFKLSFYTDASRLDERVGEIREVIDLAAAPYSIVYSVDPFNGDGLIDVLPTGVSKAYALRWWTQYFERDELQVIFAGDSGNDYSALTAGFRAILVGNADRGLANKVRDEHGKSGYRDRLFLSKEHATSGLLEGLRWFGFVQDRDAQSR